MKLMKLFGKLVFCVTAGACLHSGFAADTSAHTPPQTPPRIGLVLGGGGARGLAHLAVLQELEKLHIPISCISGTSAGALVGGIYATGRPLDEVVTQIRNADWGQILNGTPQRRSLPFSAKINDDKNLADVTLGLDANGVRLPRRAVGSQNIERFLRELTNDAYATSFDELAIPFRAVATNLITGEPKVFSGGDLAIALRASMAVPGVFDLVEEDGQLFVDGMYVRNVPIEDIKGKCADIVIAVDVGTRMLKADQIHSLLDVIAQSQNITTNRGVEQQLKLLGPQDILIQPDLAGYSPADFLEAAEIIDRGHLIGDDVMQRLRALSVDQATYAHWQDGLHQRYLAMLDRKYDKVEIARTTNVPASAVQTALGGDDVPKTRKGLSERIDSLFASGEFDHVNYHLSDRDGQRVVTVTPVERQVGPNYLRFGTEIRFDSYRTADIALLANYQMTWLNRWGAQWRNDLRLGSIGRFSSEFFQPLGASPVFVAPNFVTSIQTLPVYDDDGKHLWDLKQRSSLGALDLGLSLGRYGEVRVGPYWRYANTEIQTGFGAGLHATGRDSGVQSTLVIDQLDNPRFPRNGYYLRVTGRLGNAGDVSGSTSENGQVRELSVSADSAGTFNNTTLRASWRQFDTTGAGASDFSQLGGFLQLSGLQTNQLLGNKSELGRVMVYRQISPLLPSLGSGTYFGASLETGRMGKQVLSNSTTPWIPSASLWLGIDTFMGPLYTGLGWSNFHGGQIAGYIYLSYAR